MRVRCNAFAFHVHSGLAAQGCGKRSSLSDAIIAPISAWLCVHTTTKRYVLVGYDTGLSIRVTGVQILLPLLKLRASYLKALMVLLSVSLVCDAVVMGINETCNVFKLIQFERY